MLQTYAAEFGPKEVEKVFSNELSKEENDAYTNGFSRKLREFAKIFVLAW